MSSLTILFQDEWIVAVDKPAGYLVHPADEPHAEDLVTMKILRDQIGENVHVIHRLDRPTTGVLLFATQKRAAKKLRQAFEKRRVRKNYLAVVLGHPLAETWECKLPLRKSEDLPEKEALTSFRVLQELAGDLSLVEARPHTGRFHQIRRHLLAGGHPIIGDFRYLGEDRSRGFGDRLGTGTRMLLQAKSLDLAHPISHEPMRIEAPVDPFISQIVDKK